MRTITIIFSVNGVEHIRSFEKVMSFDECRVLLAREFGRRAKIEFDEVEGAGLPDGARDVFRGSDAAWILPAGGQGVASGTAAA